MADPEDEEDSEVVEAVVVVVAVDVVVEEASNEVFIQFGGLKRLGTRSISTSKELEHRKSFICTACGLTWRLWG